MEEKTFILEKQSLAEQVFKYVKRMILSGSFRGGERIPEEKIAQKLGVSRTPIREAFKRLNEYGIIYVKPRSYAIVKTLSYTEAEHIALIRAQLESLSAKLFTQSASEKDLIYIEQLVEDCNNLISTGNLASIFEKDSQLHLEIAKRTGNQHLYEILERLDAKVQLLRLTVCIEAHVVATDVKQHQSIINKMRDRDEVSAILLMNEHILQHFKNFRPEDY